MSRGRVNMVTADEQTEFFEIIFAPLKKISTPSEIKNAKKVAFEFVEGVTFGDINNDIIDQWDLSALSEEQADSWKWLRALKELYKSIVVNDKIKVHKFVWHKKPNEAGWGPKLVTEIMGDDLHKFLYVTKPMDEAKIELIKTVGSAFNLFQPPQRGFSHNVSVEQEKDFTNIIVLADNGQTLEKEFESIIKPLKTQSMDNLFQKIIELYLQPIIDHRPSLGFVAPVKYGKEWKYGHEWNDEKNPLQYLRDFEKTALFIVPLRWEKKGEQTHFMTLLHGDEWGGNFMAPTSNTGSIRPIDFEDAHIQRVDVELDDQGDIIDYLKPSQDQDSHKTAGGSLAYRVTSYWSGEAPPLHAYSAMSALGRLFAALIQKQTLKTNPQEADEWIEAATARFFNNLRNSLNRFISNPNGKKYLDSLNLDPEITRRGLMVRAVLAAYNWSEHWKNKTRYPDDHAECYEGKWKKSSLEEFQFQLRVQGEVEYMDWMFETRFHGYYLPMLREELDSKDWNEDEKRDIHNCIRYVNRQLHGAREEPPIYQELPMLTDLQIPRYDSFEITFEPSASNHGRLTNKINMINIHHIATSTSPEFQDFYLEDEKFMERLKKELDSNQWPEHFCIELEDWINGETPWDHVAIPEIANFQSRDEVWSKKLLEEIVELMNGTIRAQERGLSIPSRANEVTNLIEQYVRFLKAFPSRWSLVSKSEPSLIHSTILQTSEKLSEFVLDYFKQVRPNAQEVKILTKLLELASTEDPTNIEIVTTMNIAMRAVDAICYVNLSFAKQECVDEDSDFAKFLGHCIKKTISYCPKNPELGNAVMAGIVNRIFQSNHKTLREWFIKFRTGIKTILQPHENQTWYVMWFSMK